MRRLVLLCLGAAALALLIAALPKGEATPPSRSGAQPPPVVAPEAAAVSAAAVVAREPARAETSSGSAVPRPEAPRLAPLPASLRGTEVDGEIVADAGGRLVVTRETRVFFDYFLSASGEEPPELLKARIVAAIEARIPARAAVDAVTLLERYLLYRERARAISAVDPEIRLRHLRDLRRETFGPAAAEALFGEEERHDLFTLEAR